MGFCTNACLVLIAIFLPPLPVVLKQGCGLDLLINLLLCFLGWIPGMLHAWYIIFTTHRRSDTYAAASPSQRHHHHHHHSRPRDGPYPADSYSDVSRHSHHAPGPGNPAIALPPQAVYGQQAYGGGQPAIMQGGYSAPPVYGPPLGQGGYAPAMQAGKRY